MQLVGSRSVQRRAVLGTLGGANSAKPVCGRSQLVAIVIQKGMLGGEL